MRGLVVDDHAGFREVTRILLEQAGHTVAVGEADDGVSTVDAVGTHV